MNYSLVLLSLVLALADSVPVQKHVLEKRRAKPRLTAMDLKELERQCNYHSWSYCGQEITELRDASSPMHQSYNICRDDTKPRTNKVVQLTVQIPLGNNKTHNFIVEEEVTKVSEEVRCTKQDHVPSRKLYCDYVKNLTKKADNIINLELKPLVNCITTVPSDEEFTPTEIIRMLEMWVETAAQTRKSAPNCGDCRTGLEGIPKLLSSWKQRTKRCDYTNKAVWNVKLGEIARLIKANELLQTLNGPMPKDQRKKCLRGCVRPAQVECVDATGLVPRLLADI